MWGFLRLTKTLVELPMRRKTQKPFSGQLMCLNNIAMSKISECINHCVLIDYHI